MSNLSKTITDTIKNYLQEELCVATTLHYHVLVRIMVDNDKPGLLESAFCNGVMDRNNLRNFNTYYRYIQGSVLEGPKSQFNNLFNRLGVDMNKRDGEVNFAFQGSLEEARVYLADDLLSHIIYNYTLEYGPVALDKLAIGRMVVPDIYRKLILRTQEMQELLKRS